ncbi:MAG: ArdC-like ssDNA-binding domain-containing protein [Acidobacteriota bacterium]|nr:ArdC-like ssDNA-binding domain-containing protein [Acidobacteriota bacterium]
MKTDQVKQLAENALNQLMEALERGHSETLKTYLSTMSRFHRYSWGNVLLIATQKPDATHIAGFQSWLKLDRYVKKGEKGIAIFAPMVGRKLSGVNYFYRSTTIKIAAQRQLPFHLDLRRLFLSQPAV